MGSLRAREDMKTIRMLMVMVPLAAVMLAGICEAGWLKQTGQGFVIQTYTSYEPITGNNTGTITTNGNSVQFAGDNSGAIYMAGPGVQFRGANDGNVYLDGDGGLVMGAFANLSVVTNRGKGALLLGNLSAGQKALITQVGNGVILIGAGTVSNSQCIVVGDGNVSHGTRSVTAGSFWGMGSGFFGNGGGLTDLAIDGVPLTNMPAYGISVGDTNEWTVGAGLAGTAVQGSGGSVTGTLSMIGSMLELKADAGTETTSILRIWNANNDAYADIEWDTDADGGLIISGGSQIKLPPIRDLVALWEASWGSMDAWTLDEKLGRIVFSTVDPDVDVVAVTSTGIVVEAGSYYGNGSGLTNLTLNVGGAGTLEIAAGTQLVFVASGVTNVLDWDITSP
jgi:hypothetical protein